jgi:hypothetical protein
LVALELLVKVMLAAGDQALVHTLILLLVAVVELARWVMLPLITGLLTLHWLEVRVNSLLLQEPQLGMLLVELELVFILVDVRMELVEERHLT